VRLFTIGLSLDVASAGTLQLDGAPPLPEARRVGAGWGLDLSGHRSCALRPGGAAGADLVLGFEQMHVRHAVVDGAADRSRAFTFGEFIRLLGDLPEPISGTSLVERARRRVALADAARGDGPRHLGTDELVDPFGRSRDVYRRAGNEVWRLSFALVTGLFEVGRTAGLPGPERPGAR
jgi:protein-tyrosine phosphatase